MFSTNGYLERIYQIINIIMQGSIKISSWNYRLYKFWKPKKKYLSHFLKYY